MDKPRMEKPKMLEPNKVYAYTLDLWQTGFTFGPKEKIRVEISSAAFPFFSRNLNTGGHNEMDTTFRKANQKVFHSSTYPSHVILPVIPSVISFAVRAPWHSSTVGFWGGGVGIILSRGRSRRRSRRPRAGRGPSPPARRGGSVPRW